MALQHCDDNDINALADILSEAGCEYAAKNILNQMNDAGEFDAAVAIFIAEALKNSVSIPRTLYDDIISCYSLNPLDMDYCPRMFNGMKQLEENKLVK
ncbi:hypothetical protein GCM10007377_02960 [Galliscardovia ingluviei]|uniref:Uncharacterized protein n=1 Tax=Galliscardovia ingluviei TaxID=1769422 RepID=A0A8J3AEH0_9BIFI|nr:hypothetical protein [Galliscardovia ingluviei]GGI12838.1 hypothetical protein GCM10007377_02960 [Galliscardovia ingluviei]